MGNPGIQFKRKIDSMFVTDYLLPRLRLSIFIFILSVGWLQAQPSPDRMQTIFCIGNSITTGARTLKPEAESYPAVLQSLLIENGYQRFQVRNLGIGGATMLKFGTPNLWRNLDTVRQYVPDIVIIKAGTNETVGSPRMNWEHISDFEKDYTEYIRTIKSVNPKCRIIICSPPDMQLDAPGLSPERLADLTTRRPRIWELRSRVKALAKANDVYFFDLTKLFRNKAALITPGDGVHPNTEGYRYLATALFRYLIKKDIIEKP